MSAILLLHFAIGIAIIASGDRLGARSFAVAAIAPTITLAWLATRFGDLLDGAVIEHDVEWVPALDLSLSMRADAFSLVMILLISGIGLLVSIYAVSYFSHPEPGTARLAGLMTMFAGSMLGVVLADHLIALFVFWELTSITSYLLIGNDDTDPDARDSALSAILITGAGGLAMLAGFVLIGQSAGTYRLSELVTAPPSGTTVTVGLLLVLLGAFTKSAQVPFTSWLPGAMVAPTPISTYLHAATMVKAGVYLVARMSPLFASTGGWRTIVVIVGSLTMLYGGWRAMRQHDLKLLLAFGTVSQLGFLMVLFGAGLYASAQAGVVLLLAHGAFKATLFMIVGIVDHQVGTRDVRRLHGFGAGWRPVVAMAVIGAASMAGIPPLVGFISKEKALKAWLDADLAGSGIAVAAIVVGSVLTFAYSARFVLGLTGHLADSSEDVVSRQAPAPSWSFMAPAAVLAAFSVVAGIVPFIIDELVRDATVSLYPESHPKAVELWAGFNLALVLSIVIIGVGAALAVGRTQVERTQSRIGSALEPVPTTDGTFWAAVDGILLLARRTTAVVQNGSLPLYLMVILGVAALAPLTPALMALDEWPDAVEHVIHLPIVGIIVVAAIGAALMRRRIAAALMLSGVGYAMAGLYVVEGAPDLALTQFAIETLSTVLFVLVLRFLPREAADQRSAVLTPIRLFVSAAVGISVFVFAIAATGARSDVAAPQISEEMVARSLPDGKGANVVNVILVDFRGFDTMGEITVLVVAAIGTVAMARAAAPSLNEVRERRASGAVTDSGLDRLPLLDAWTRFLFPSILVLALYFLFAGHNQPGGGFVGGLTVGAAISLRYVAGGVEAVRSTFRFRPTTILGSGLLLSSTTALTPIVLGNSVLEHALFDQKFPLIGSIKATSALPFDIGVFLVVVGVVLMAFEAFGESVAPGDPGVDAEPSLQGADA